MEFLKNVLKSSPEAVLALLWCVGLCLVFKVIPLLANDGEGTLLCNSLLPGSEAVVMNVKICKISYLAACFVVWGLLCTCQM